MTAANVSRLPEPKPPRKPKKKATVAAREAEAEDGYVTIEHYGVTLRVPAGGKVPVAATDAFRVGDNYEGTKQIIGEKQWALLRDAGMTMDGLNELGAKLRDSWGN